MEKSGGDNKGGREMGNKILDPVAILFIPQDEHRYSTVGDYQEGNFRITNFDNPAYSWAVMLHELVEKFLKDQDGITDEQVDAWDMGPGADLDDPGLHPDCPYHKHHMMADVIERMFIVISGEDWIEYEKAIEALFPGD